MESVDEIKEINALDSNILSIGQKLLLKKNDENALDEYGIYVVQILADGPAKKSGLKVGDVITKVDDFEVNKMSELRAYIYTKNPGDTVVLTINRVGKEYTASIKLGKR